MAEHDWIRRYLAPLARAPGAAGLEDDCALVAVDGPLVATVDAMVAGVHALAGDPVEGFARKLVRVNVSDVMACGASPCEALLALTWPKEAPEAAFQRFAGALGEELAVWGAALLGGDTVFADGPMQAALTLTGRCHGDGPVRRSGGAADEDLWITGVVGAGGEGLKAALAGRDGPVAQAYRVPPLPPLQTARLVADLAGAAIDVSDGLLVDASRLAAASGVAARLEIDAAPLAAPSGDVTRAMEQCTAGDDYQILFSAHRSARPEIESRAERIGVQCRRIGQLLDGAGLSARWRGEPVNLPERLGFEHGP